MPEMHADLKFRYYIVEHYADVYGTNDRVVADNAIDNGHIVIDTQLVEVRQLVSPAPELVIKAVQDVRVVRKTL